MKKNEKIDKIYKIIEEEIRKNNHKNYVNYIKDLNDRLYNAVYTFGINYDEEDFSNMLADILLYNYGSKKSFNVYKNYNEISLEKNIKLVKEFFSTLPGIYTNLYDDFLEESEIFFHEPYEDDFLYNGTYIPNKTAYYPAVNIINISLSNNINDSSKIVHELMHYTNSKLDRYNQTSNYYTEALSSFMQLCYSDFLEENYPEYKSSAKAMKREWGFYSLYIPSLMMKYFFMLINEVQEGRYINEKTFENIEKELEKEFKLPSNLIRYCEDLVLDEIQNGFPLGEDIKQTDNGMLIIPYQMEGFIRNNSGYILALGLCYTMYDIYKKEGIEKILDLNESLEYSNFEDVLNNLALTDDWEEDEDIISLDFGKIEDNFIKYKKKLW